jgi:hypothetical protein
MLGRLRAIQTIGLWFHQHKPSGSCWCTHLSPLKFCRCCGPHNCRLPWGTGFLVLLLLPLLLLLLLLRTMPVADCGKSCNCSLDLYSFWLVADTAREPDRERQYFSQATFCARGHGLMSLRKFVVGTDRACSGKGTLNRRRRRENN